MAELAYDPNQQDDAKTTTDILSPSGPTQQSTDGSDSASSTGASYVSDGNPYGSYGQSSQQSGTQQNQSTRQSTTNKPSSGSYTNVQNYINKNQAGSQKLGQAVSGKIQNTSDIAKQNLSGVEQKFQQGMDAGSIENWQGAVDEAKTSFNQAANQTAPTQNFVENTASMYKPQQQNGQYSEADQALINSNQARAVFGDGTTKDFGTQDEAQSAIDDWNKQNPGYYQYGENQQLSSSDDRLADILNAQYTGPSDLYQMAGYNQAYNDFNRASALQELAQQPGFKGTLLKETFQNPNTNYSLGNQVLDDLLLGQGQANAQLQQTAKNLGSTASGKLSDEFSSRTKDARQSAVQRSADIDDVRTSARQALSDVGTGRQGEVNDRINKVVENWDQYPDYFRNAFQKELDTHNAAKGQVANYKDLSSKLQTAQQQLPLLEKAVQAGPPKRVTQGKYVTTMGVTDYIPSTVLNANAQKAYQNSLAQYNAVKQNVGTYQQQLNSLTEQYGDLSNFDPNSLNLKLSQLEAEMLGIQGGEGVYDLLSQPGGIDNLIRTAESDRNRLISRDEQSQLARLQQIAELANDYGSKDSGINYRNQFTDRDAAGTQTALDALDMNYLRDQLQGRESKFRQDANASTITGVGVGKGSSGGAFGKKTKKVTRYLDANLGDLIDQADGWRNIYSDKGVNQENVDKILGLSDILASQQGGYTDRSGETGIPDPENYIPGAAGLAESTLTSPLGPLGDIAFDKVFGNSLVGQIVNPNTLLDIGTMGLGNVVGNIGSSIAGGAFGNSAKAAKKAERKAYDAAQKDLEKKVTQRLLNEGYNNQFAVTQNQQKDLELLKLLGLLDTTNR